MSNSRHIWTVAHALQTEVRSGVSGSDAIAALDNGIRILTTIANALEACEDPEALAMFGGEIVDTDRMAGPVENAAAYRNTAASIARSASAIAEAADYRPHLPAIREERRIIDAAICRMDQVERAGPISTEQDFNSIDPLRLRAYLRQHTGNAALEIKDFRLIVGGRSRQTALLEIADGGILPVRMVIQRGIPGLAVSSIFANEATQFHLLGKLHAAGMRVPRPVLVETDPQWLDAPFLLAEQVPGRTVQSDYWLPATDEAVAIDLARQMAVLHAQPIAEVGQGLHHARERYDREGWLEELNQLASYWNAHARWPSVTMSAAIEWMRANVDCLDDRRAVVHNDMIFHNILAENGEITAVLDWEQCAIGHPGEDLGYCYPVVRASADWSRFMQAYREAGGPEVTQRQIDFFALRSGLRMMNLVLMGGRDAFAQGTSDSVLVASAGAHFTQRLLHRISSVLEDILLRG